VAGLTAGTVRGLRSLSGRDPATYQRHRLHRGERSHLETNCYTDVLIELLHACGYEPLAMLGHLVRIDFEGDQWTFFKPPAEDLETLFGLDIHEMQPYRPLPLQIAEQIERGRTVIVELDSFYLPDTVSTSYRTEHVKTSIAADAIDTESQTLRYFHNTGLHELSGEDYRGAFRIGDFAADVLPPYTELARFEPAAKLEQGPLREAARGLLARHLERRPATNPFARFGVSLAAELQPLLAGELREYHAYAFATVRMAGAAFELAASHLEWLYGDDAIAARAAMQEIVDGCKVLSFRLARRKPFAPEGIIEALACAWDSSIAALEEVSG
jgi:hypothetical protein